METLSNKGRFIPQCPWEEKKLFEDREQKKIKQALQKPALQFNSSLKFVQKLGHANSSFQHMHIRVHNHKLSIEKEEKRNIKHFVHFIVKEQQQTMMLKQR